MNIKKYLIFSFILVIFISCSTSFKTTNERLIYWIGQLSSDDFLGRKPGTEGGNLTKNFIANEFKKLNLSTIDKEYFLKVPASKITLEDKSYLTVSFRGTDRKLITGDEIVFWTKHAKEYKKLRDSEMVFVGYGIVAPEYGWNDYDGIDVKGKTVVMLINDPGFHTGNLRLFNGKSMTYYGRWTYKFEEAAKQGASGAIIIHEESAAAYPWSVVENSWLVPQLDLQRKNLGEDRSIVEGWVPHNVFNDLISYTGFNYQSLVEIALDKTFRPFNLRGMSLSTEIYNEVEYFESHNVAAVKKGKSKPDEYILITAHWDHLGVLDNDDEDNIANGAVDNATGIAALLELATQFHNVDTERSILFLTLTLEESGLLGSEYFAMYPPMPLNQIVAGFNFDGILPTGKTNDMVVIGYGASDLEDMLEEVLIQEDRYINPDPNPEKGYFYRSDHISFAKRGVPMIYADGGVDLVNGGKQAGIKIEDDYRTVAYHGVSDEYDESWDLEGLEQTIKTISKLINHLSNSEEWPNWYEGNEFRNVRDQSMNQ